MYCIVTFPNRAESHYRALNDTLNMLISNNDVDNYNILSKAIGSIKWHYKQPPISRVNYGNYNIDVNLDTV